MKNTLTILLLLGSTCLAAQTTIVPFNSVWKYLDNGTDAGTAWRATSFSDAAWPSGPGELGYGDGDEATVVSYGPRKNRKYITTYFRKAVTISNPAQYSTFRFQVNRDDGVVVYLNGSEVYRNNLPSGAITYTTLASADAADDGNTAQTFTVPVSAFATGTNVIAVEIHQYRVTNSDISFDLELVGSAPPSPACGVPSGLAVTSITPSSATLSWTAVSGATGYTVQYRRTGTTTWTTTTTTASSVGISALTAATQYEFQVQAQCSGSSSAFSASATFTTQTSSPPTTATLTRGPYLQMVGSSAATLRWRTDVATDSRIEAGTTLGSYTLSATNGTVTTEHVVRITGLAANTKYLYRFGSSTQVLQEGSDNYFTTAPPANTTQKIRIAAFGDCGVAGTVQQNVLNAYLNYVGSNPAQILLLLGDNAYQSGTDAEYQSQFFSRYSSTILKNHALFPVPGNHDYYSSSQTSRSGAYYNNFTLPTAGECGGVASGTEAYYSWDWGPIHFLSLDSYGQEAGPTRLYDTLGPQVTWVKQDLAANTRKWTIVYWHHPPFTMGTHNSDTEGELINIRSRFIRILERYGVDLVICGHSHNYERSFLLRDYYGSESTFNMSTHTVTSSSGKFNGTPNSCAYVTNSGKYNHGTVYVVSGSAARSNLTMQGSFPHNALPYATRAGGMFYLVVEDNRLDGRMITENGTWFDQFTIMKDVNKTSNLTVPSGQPTTLTASWVGTYQWSTGATTRSITVTPTANATYSVRDNQGCLTDVFNVSTAATMAIREREALTEGAPLAQVYPTLVSRGQAITVHTNPGEAIEAVLVDNNGRQVRTFKYSGNTYINTKNLASGTYYLTLRGNRTFSRQRFIVTD